MRSPSPHRLLHLMPLLPPAAHSHVPGNAPTHRSRGHQQMWPIFGALLQAKALHAKQNMSDFSLSTRSLVHRTSQQHITTSHPPPPSRGGQGPLAGSALPGSSSQRTKHWWVQVLFLLGAETFGICCTGEKPSLVLRCPQGCLHLQARVHSTAFIVPAIPPSLLTCLVDTLFKPIQTLCEFTIQPEDKWSLAGYIPEG